MSVRTTHEHAVCLYDSVTGLAFGPVFEDESQADEFIDWLTVDPRSYTSEQLAAKFLQYKADGLYQITGGQ